MTYVRVTENPNMGWSNERKAEASARQKKMHADGTWHKKSKKAVSMAISNGLKESIKHRNRSNGQKRRHQNDQENIKKLQQESSHSRTMRIAEDVANIDPSYVSATEKVLTQGVEDAERYCINWEKINSEMREGSDKPAPIEISKMHMNFITELFNKIEDIFGIRPDVGEFVGSAIEDKLQSVWDKLRKE